MSEIEPADKKGPIQVSLHASSIGELASQITTDVPSMRKELAAKWIAYAIVAMAGLSLLLLIWRGFRLIELSISNPENAKRLVTESLLPLIEKVATFFTTVFGPLLAFILGYYFGERQAQRRSGDR